MKDKRAKATKDEHIRELCSDPLYRIYEEGTIDTRKGKKGTQVLDHWRPLTLNKNKGYIYVTYKQRKLALHRIIYQRYIGELDDTLVINHIDGNGLNNHYNNLELITLKRNTEHSIRTLKRGGNKLTFELAEQIRKEQIPTKDLAKKYKVHERTIQKVLANESWVKKT